MEVPNHSTIAEFRRRHQDAVGELFVEVLALCAEVGLVSTTAQAPQPLDRARHRITPGAGHGRRSATDAAKLLSPNDPATSSSGSIAQAIGAKPQD